MKSMCEIINLFVDGEITTPESVDLLLAGEEITPAEIAETATRLLPPAQAERILKLLKRKAI